jgi:hypothetical protein
VQFYQYFPIPSAMPESIPITEYIPDRFVFICEKPDISSDRSAFSIFLTTTMPYNRKIYFRENYSADWEEGFYLRKYYYYYNVLIVSFLYIPVLFLLTVLSRIKMEQ